MTFHPGLRHPLARIAVTPYGMHGTVRDTTAATSSGWGTANLAEFFPLHFWEPFTVSKMFWLNGATTGTDSFDFGIYRMTDLTTGRLDLIRSTGAVLSAGTANQTAASGTWKVARTGITSGTDSTDGTSFTTASVTLKAGRLYLLAVTNSKAAAPNVISAVTGGGTWTSEKTVSFNSAASPTQRLTVMRMVPAVDYTGTIVIDFGGGNTQTGCAWSLVEMSGVDTTTNNGVVQSVSNTTDSGTSVTATLAAFGSANNPTFGASAKGSTGGFTPGTGFTELHDVNYSTPNAALETEWRVDNDTTVDQSWSGATGAAVIGVEVKADASPFVIPEGWSYLGGACNGTTATLFLRSLTRQVSEFAGVYELTSSFPLPSTCTPVAVSGARRIPVAGVSSRSTI